MAVEKDFELLDDYLANRLNGEQKSAFEQKLNVDTTLKNEYQLQENLIKNIKKARVSELKSMLNNVPIPPASGGSTVVAGKLVFGVVASALVGVGIYFFLQKENNTIVTEKPVTHIQEKTYESKEKSPETNKLSVDKPGTAVIEKQAAKSPEKQPIENTSKNTSVPVKSDGTAVDVFDPTTEVSGNSNNSNATNVKVETGSTARPTSSSSIVVEVDNKNNAYTFHYQFKDGRLYLYGAFEKNLYEIMEFFGNNKRTVFLFYKDNYYLLNEENEKIKPITLVNDPVLLKKLQEYRGK